MYQVRKTKKSVFIKNFRFLTPLTPKLTSQVKIKVTIRFGVKFPINLTYHILMTLNDPR